MPHGFWKPVPWVAVVLCLFSCHRSDRPKLHEAKGTVTFAGQPLADATVTFIPESGLVAVGKTDSSGNFSLKTQGDLGATEGEYRVVITAIEQKKTLTAEEMEKLTDEERRKLGKSRIPARYGDPNGSELWEKVAASGPNTYSFNLEK